MEPQSKLKILSSVASSWYGVVLVEVARSLGWSYQQLGKLEDRGAIEVYGGRALRFASVPWSFTHRVALGTAAAGPESGGGFRTAAAVHRLDGWSREPDEVEIVVPRRVRRRAFDIDRVVLRSSTRLRAADIVTVRELPVTSVAWTLARIGRFATMERVEESLDGAEHDARVERASVATTLASIRGRGVSGVRKLDTVLQRREDVGATARDVLQRRFARLIEAAGLPVPDLEYPVLRADGKQAFLDAAFPWCQLGVELDGHIAHATRRQRRNDAQRQNQVWLSDFSLLRFTWEQVHDEPGLVVATVAAALERRASGPAA